MPGPMGEMFAQDAYGMPPFMQPQPRARSPFMPGAPVKRPPLTQGGIAPMGGMTPQGGVGNPGTQDADRMFDLAGGRGSVASMTGADQRAGGNLGLQGTFDPSMWNTALPMGSFGV